MSLKVYLLEKKAACKYCGREEEEREVYSRNITHNLTEMAEEAGIYYELWRPEEKGITIAKQLIEPLTKGLDELKKAPVFFSKFNPSNRWGDYDGLVKFVEDYLNACKQCPDAEVEVSR